MEKISVIDIDPFTILQPKYSPKCLMYRVILSYWLSDAFNKPKLSASVNEVMAMYTVPMSISEQSYF